VREFNRKKYAWLSLEEMLAVSSNVAAAKIGLQLGAESLYSILERFELGQPTGLDFPGEAKGILRPAGSWRPIDLANISFGQGIATTPLQMVRTFAAFANGGYLVRPHLVERIQSIEEKPRVVWEREIERKEVVSAELARSISQMLVSVTKEGATGSKAGIDGFEVAGKTGTSQKVIDKEVNGKMLKTYSSQESIASFIGYVPAHDPAFVLLVMYDAAEGINSGGFTAAPSFRRIASQALGVLGVSRPMPVARQRKEASPHTDFIGKSFQEVLREVRAWEEEEQARVELYGIGRATREELVGSQRRIYFEE
jgi:cell division protein FtsI (penicillin-binding protein 3)